MRTARQLQSSREGGFAAGLAVALVCMPGIILIVLALFGIAPTHGDLQGYVVPLRQRTAEVLAGDRGPFWNPDVGCGEVFFANPQSNLLYPPAWLATVLNPNCAIGFEAGLHWIVLALGLVVLGRRLSRDGETPILALAAGAAAAVLSGPMSDAIGVLQNLDSLAWVPWIWWAALSGHRLRLALVFAASILAAEPQLAAIAALGALVLAPRLSTLVGLVLGAAAVAVQIIPFVFWVLGGDRGPNTILGTPSGCLNLTDLPGLVFPDYAAPARPDRFFNNLYITPWLIILGISALKDRSRTLRRLAVFGVLLACLATIASLPVGRHLWAILTLGMVRFPARLLLISLIALAPVAALRIGTVRIRPRLALALCGMLAIFSSLLPFPGLSGVPGLLAATWVVAGPAPVLGAWAGVLVSAPVAFEALELNAPPPMPAVLCLNAQTGGRAYTLEPSWNQFSWALANAAMNRGASLGFGYTALRDGRHMVRTFAPLKSRALAEHLAGADQGPPGRWWLDSLAAPRIVAHHPVAGFPRICGQGGLFVYENRQAWSQFSVFNAMPVVDQQPIEHGRILSAELRDGRRSIFADVKEPKGFLVISATPDPGWRLSVDGQRSRIVQGPGILHGVELPSGRHRIEMRYRPPGLVTGGILSLMSLVAMIVLASRGVNGNRH